METTRVFWSGRSQAVRLPKEYRLDVDRVRIRRRGSSIILDPLESNWDWLNTIAEQLDDDAAEAAEETPAEQVRPALDELFE